VQITNNLLAGNRSIDSTEALGVRQNVSPHAHPRGGNHGDQVQLSALATQLAATDPSKLSELQAAYKAGTYNVSPDQIARSIIASARKT
jgi:anti-sigma28 factor (negative regulator of flagellin synthesis)